MNYNKTEEYVKRDLDYFITITKECVKKNGKEVSDECIKYYAEIVKAGYDMAKNEEKIDKKHKRFIRFLSCLIDYIIYVVIAFIFTIIAKVIGAPEWGAVLFGVVVISLFIRKEGGKNDNSRSTQESSSTHVL